MDWINLFGMPPMLGACLIFFIVGLFIEFIWLVVLPKLKSKDESETQEDVADEDNELGEEFGEDSGETYEATMVCENCGAEQTLDVPKGTCVEDYFENAECEVCGANTGWKKLNTEQEDE